jgi:hypothetical protein
MPCSSGMRTCRTGCLHRRLVGDYRAAKHAETLTTEAATGGYQTETRERAKTHPPLTFKAWLVGTGRAS